MKKTIGILAHVDAGKTHFFRATTLSYKQYKETQIGRVDYKNSYLDNHNIERARWYNCIFS